MYVIGLNGPPRSGKDTVADSIRMQLLRDGYSCKVIHTAAPMRKAAFSLLGLESTHVSYEAVKDLKQQMTGDTVRQLMIQLSEEFIKPKYGQDYWARLLQRRINVWVRSLGRDEKKAPVVIIPDIGFDVEANMLGQTHGEQYANVFLNRKGKHFRNDSRSYVKPDCHAGINMHVTNEENKVQEAVTEILNHLRILHDWDIK